VKVGCPTCGAEVEFRYDDSHVRVCGHCRSAVTRTDRGVETLGRFADLVPIESPLRLFADGYYGEHTFILIGMAQLQHGSGGVWQEWYAKLGSGHWGWLSEAQGRLYMTFEHPDVPVPPLHALVPGARVVIQNRNFVVGERGTATYLAATGEIPYRLVPNTSFQFVDLSDGAGGFATIDYGDGEGDDDGPTVYIGRQFTPEQLRISGGEQPPTQARQTGGALQCPNCNGALELRAPDQSLRVACPYCNDLVNVEHGQLSIIAKQGQKPTLAIPLGSTGTFSEGDFTVIGWVRRSAHIDGTWYPFEEYLLHAPNVGFRWLVCSDDHWSYVQPVANGAVTRDSDPRYDGVKFAPFQRSVLRVDSVLGELYWRVTVGEKVEAADYIAPPAMLSREVSEDEQHWSLSSYLTRAEVNRAFGKQLQLRSPIGVAPNQPYPGGVGTVIGLFTVALCAVGIGKCARSIESVKYEQRITVPPGPATAAAPTPDPGGEPAEAPGHIKFSPTFQLDEHANIEIAVEAFVENTWAYVAIDLVNEKTGMLISFDKSLEYYSGYEGGESWSEGSRSDSQVLGPVEPGAYVLRVEAQQGSPSPIVVEVKVIQGVFRLRWFLVALGVLAIPFGLVCLHASSFRKKRWENSNVGAHASHHGDDD
jgi:hypothetical protein